MIRKLSIAALTLFLLSFALPFYAVSADEEERITVSTEVGFNNLIKANQGFPIAVTLKNNGEDISGELAISVMPGYNWNNGMVITQADLPANSEKTFLLSLPGYSNMHYGGPGPVPDDIHFYEGGWQNGKKVKLGGQTKLTPAHINEEDIVVGLLTDNPDAFNYLKNARAAHGNSMRIVPVDPKQLPNDSAGLTMFNTIIIDQYSVAEALSPEQQDAVEAWVDFGGTLVIGADPGLQQKLDSLAVLLPMGLEMNTKKEDADFFNKGDRKYPAKTIDLTAGAVSDGANILQRAESGTPVAARAFHGSGQVVQLAFSPGAKSFAEWDGAESYWTETFQSVITPNYMDYESVYDRLNWGLAETTSLFPSSFLPFSVLVTIFIVYVLIIFPVIYFLLKKIDKREHSWWILPAISLLISAGIFGFGGKDRIAQPQINESLVVTVDEQGEGRGYGSVSVLSNNSGDYELNVATAGFAAFPIRSNYSMGSTPDEPDGGIRQQGDQLDILFKDVEYWSIRNASGPISKIDIGELETDLEISGEQEISGTVTNPTELRIDDLVFLSGRQKESLGSLGPGETIEVNIELTGSLLQAPVADYYYNYSNDMELAERKKEDLMRTMHEFDMFEKGKPVLAAFTGDQLLNSSISGREALTERTGLIVHPLDFKGHLSGPFELKGEDFLPYFYSVDGHIGSYDFELHPGERTVYAPAGKYEFSYTVPVELLENKAAFSELGIKIRHSGGFTYEVFNVETETFDSLDENNTFKSPEKYIEEYGQIRIQISKGEMPDEVFVPELSLKGEMKRD
ncbi:hypothetical protein [Evansella clarkii]|uniref:hypothetical protein n=1 Tax=Evansella clarkii TaxID=79879 RepID=UPI000996D47A|nr:hypothetical protein [Evansella clarkii]